MQVIMGNMYLLIVLTYLIAQICFNAIDYPTESMYNNFKKNYIIRGYRVEQKHSVCL